ncbi:MAG: hypothetical protein EA343_17080 [Nodularia sp. (in: Bacteria)]|nr:MAG: hypothetical protein EA343_17080 [Nodularia sp. (in: cyanobacteria)]
MYQKPKFFKNICVFGIGDWSLVIGHWSLVIGKLPSSPPCSRSATLTASLLPAPLPLHPHGKNYEPKALNGRG